MHWMNENYGRILDLFRRFDSDNSGKLSYEEFADGMRDLGTYLNLNICKNKLNGLIYKKPKAKL